MRKFRSYKILCLTLGIGIAVSGTVLNASSLTKTLKAIYSNIGISYNGQTKLLSSEPFIVGGVTYVPLRAVGEIMGASVNWANNTVYITGQSSTTVSSEQELAAKNFEIASLTQKLTLANTELAALKATNLITSPTGTNLNTSAINTTLKKITDTYDEDYDVDWTFNLSLVSGRLQLTASYDSRYDSAAFNKTTESKRKQFIKEICYDIASAHKDTEIRGTIEDSRNNTEKASFKYTSSGSYTYNETASFSLTDLQKDLEKYYKNIDCVGFTIPINYIDLTERNSQLTFTITTNLRPGNADYRQQWNDLDSSYTRALETFLDRIRSDIEHDTNYDQIVGVIKDTATGSNIGSFEDNKRFYLSTVTTR